ncbi:hypothetical protein L873DRAFT_1806583 [Choiromyces venosus 120613-1]|uniref:Uncharacterized protein n=1 Tax=Choiromyces venosus 120613-1 TaxID=1336337 RepID=A0A3N4JME7_9PEZI|nr:hypothetical protein L873DRAFT_1806583 [Choiromyces venosus 120613-1]
MEEEKDWDRLKVQKTKFWDFLDPEERTEAGRSFSGVLGWLSRNESRGRRINSNKRATC